MKWKILESEYISKHKYFTARKDKCETPDGHIVPEYYVVELPQTVCCVPITEEGEVLMVKQYRHPVEEVMIEVPGGFIDEGETAEEAMRRELKEETGYEFSSYTYVGKIAANPGILNNFTFFFLAKGGKKTSEQNLDENEEVVVEKVSIAELKKLFLENKILQATHNSCIFYALHEMGEL
ncbi:MAG: NUDIX hydrolase [Ginsengibacter sp.]|jgi:ADP-ribose pyrophosphatase YjhB (NUDIX family)